jgi:hypothetical protein
MIIIPFCSMLQESWSWKYVVKHDWKGVIHSRTPTIFTCVLRTWQYESAFSYIYIGPTFRNTLQFVTVVNLASIILIVNYRYNDLWCQKKGKKAKLFLCLINYVPRHEDVMGSTVRAPSFLTSALDGGWVVSFTPRPLHLRVKGPPISVEYEAG